MSKEVMTVGQQSPALVTHGFGTQSVASRGEMAASAMGARETAMTQARFVCAMRNPRNVDQFRAFLVQECRRPAFAAKAMYARPVGKAKDSKGEWVQTFAEGPSIRLVEAALASYGNIEVISQEVYDDETARIVQIRVLDLQTNVSCSAEISVPKFTEKKGKKDRQGWLPPDGRNVISERLNSYGDPTYLCVATEDEVIMKQSALVSKAIRTLGLRILPPDVIGDCVTQIRATIEAGAAAEDPTAAKKRLLDAFASLAVLPVDIERYLGHPIDRLAPAEMKQLRVIYTSIASGDSTWESYTVDAEGDEEASVEAKKAAVAEAEAKIAGRNKAKAAAAAAQPLQKKPQESPEQPEPSDAVDLTEEDMRRLDSEAAKREGAQQQGQVRRPINFGGK